MGPWHGWLTSSWLAKDPWLADEFMVGQELTAAAHCELKFCSNSNGEVAEDSSWSGRLQVSDSADSLPGRSDDGASERQAEARLAWQAERHPTRAAARLSSIIIETGRTGHVGCAAHSS